jgi:hypothetical protein
MNPIPQTEKNGLVLTSLTSTRFRLAQGQTSEEICRHIKMHMGNDMIKLVEDSSPSSEACFFMNMDSVWESPTFAFYLEDAIRAIGPKVADAFEVSVRTSMETQKLYGGPSSSSVSIYKAAKQIEQVMSSFAPKDRQELIRQLSEAHDLRVQPDGEFNDHDNKPRADRGTDRGQDQRSA